TFDASQDAVLIGENNSGKTSLLRILDWLFNEVDDSLLLGERGLSSDEEQLLLPARATRNRARRIYLRIHIPDGRSARKFSADSEGIAEVRIQFRRSDIYAKLGAPMRGENPDTESNALELLERLQENYACL